MREPIPSYGRPPVVEAVVGAEFLPIDQLNTVQLVHLHDRWAHRFPRIELQPELPSASRFANQLPVVFNTGVPPVRLWSLGDGDEILVQVQTDRLVVNWRRINDESQYPRYGELLRIFDECWTDLVDHLRDLGDVALVITDAEVTYVNSIQYDVTQGPGDALTILSDESGLPTARDYRLQRVWRLPADDRNYEPNVTVNVATDSPGTFRMDVVTRVSVGSIFEEDPRPALDLAHEVSVRTFTSCTTTSKHDEWERKE